MNKQTLDNISGILAKSSDPDFCAQAMADYLDDCSNYTEQLISACDSALSDTSVIDAEYDDETPPTTEEIVTRILTEHDLVGSVPVALNDGYTTIHDLIYNLVEQGNSLSDPESDDSVAGETIYQNLTSGLTLTDLAGNVVPNISYSVNDISTQLTDNLHHLWVARSAMIASQTSEIGDRITIFVESVKEKFKDIYTDVSNSVSYYKAQLSNKLNSGRDIVNNFINDSGIIILGDDDVSDDASIVDTDLSKYTGSSPVTGFDLKEGFDNVGKNAKQVCKIAKNIIGGILQGVWSVAKPIFKKVGNVVQAITSNPVDLEVYNTSGSTYAIDGFSHQCTKVDHKFFAKAGTDAGWETALAQCDDICNNQFMPLESPATRWVAYCNALLPLVGKWEKYKFRFGEVLVKLDDLYANYYPDPESYDHERIDIRDCPNYATADTDLVKEYSILIKAYPVHQDDINQAIKAVCPSVWNSGVIHPGGDQNQWKFEGLTIADCTNILNYIDRQGGFSTPNISVDIGSEGEKVLYADYYNGMHYMMDLGDRLAGAIDSGLFTSEERGLLIPTSGYTKKNGTGTAGAVTNIDFLYTACSINKQWNPDNQNFNTEVWAAKSHRGFIEAIMIQRIQRLAYPGNYVFIPYRNDMDSFDSCKVKIKTDDENSSVLSTFIAAAIVVAIVAVLAITVSVKVKKFKRARLQKKMNYVGKMDNALWNGDTSFTDKDMRKYIRYTNKISNSSFFSNGLVTSAAASMPSVTYDNGSQAAELIKLIRGIPQAII